MQNPILLGTYMYVINYNFVTTEPIFKIRNSAESYCLAESEFSAQKCQNAKIP